MEKSNTDKIQNYLLNWQIFLQSQSDNASLSYNFIADCDLLQETNKQQNRS